MGPQLSGAVPKEAKLHMQTLNAVAVASRKRFSPVALSPFKAQSLQTPSSKTIVDRYHHHFRSSNPPWIVYNSEMKRSETVFAQLKNFSIPVCLAPLGFGATANRSKLMLRHEAIDQISY
jgi:hypothetical protein